MLKKLKSIILCGRLSNIIRKLFCSHNNSIKTIYLEDRIYDRAIDNDDLDDYFRTFIEIKYCTKCGKIINKKHTLCTDNKFNGGLFQQYNESTLDKIEKFEHITGLVSNKITLFH